MGNRVNPYLMALFMYGIAALIAFYPSFSKASDYEVMGIWDHPTKKGKWIVEVEKNGKTIKFEIDDLVDKAPEEKAKTIKWMAEKSVQKLESK